MHHTSRNDKYSGYFDTRNDSGGRDKRASFESKAEHAYERDSHGAEDFDEPEAVDGQTVEDHVSMKAWPDIAILNFRTHTQICCKLDIKTIEGGSSEQLATRSMSVEIRSNNGHKNGLPLLCGLKTGGFVRDSIADILQSKAPCFEEDGWVKVQWHDDDLDNGKLVHTGDIEGNMSAAEDQSTLDADHVGNAEDSQTPGLLISGVNGVLVYPPTFCEAVNMIEESLNGESCWIALESKNSGSMSQQDVAAVPDTVTIRLKDAESPVNIWPSVEWIKFEGFGAYLAVCNDSQIYPFVTNSVLLQSPDEKSSSITFSNQMILSNQFARKGRRRRRRRRSSSSSSRRRRRR